MASTHPTVAQRRQHRERPAPHFRRLAATWSGLLGFNITAEQACLMLAVMKVVREFPKHDGDNIEDAEGYLSLIEEIREESADESLP